MKRLRLYYYNYCHYMKANTTKNCWPIATTLHFLSPGGAVFFSQRKKPFTIENRFRSAPAEQFVKQITLLLRKE